MWVSARSIRGAVFLSFTEDLILGNFLQDVILWEHILGNGAQSLILVLGGMLGHHFSFWVGEQTHQGAAKGVEALHHPLLPYLAPFSSSIWLFLTCTLYNMPENTCIFLSFLIYSNKLSNPKGRLWEPLVYSNWSELQVVQGLCLASEGEQSCGTKPL